MTIIEHFLSMKFNFGISPVFSENKKPFLFVLVTRVKAVNGQMKVKKAYIKTNKAQNSKTCPYEIPEFCPCDEIYDGVTSLVLGQSDYFRRNGDETSILFNSATTIAKWNGKKMKKLFNQKMSRKIYRRCHLLTKG